MTDVVPPSARLGDASRLQAMHEPTPALRLVPRHILQQTAPAGIVARMLSTMGLGGGAVLVHVMLGAAFFFLLSFRDAEVPRDIEIPVEVVGEPSKPSAKDAVAKVDPVRTGNRPETVSSDPAAPPAPPAPTLSTEPKPSPPVADVRPRDPMAGAAMSAPHGVPTATSPSAVPAPASPSTVPQATEAAVPPKLVAPPPEVAKAATQPKENKPANLVPQEHRVDQATREPRPAAIPDALVTPDGGAQTSVPVAHKAQPATVDKPLPPTTAKVPSQADKLAAALPMDPSAMPSSFRSVLAGNAAAQINAAYGGVVQGLIRQATAALSAAASQEHLSGAVVVAFTLDDAGGLANLTLVQGSGNPQLDAMVLGAIRQIAPFPAPPAEAEHTFHKAFLIGA